MTGSVVGQILQVPGKVPSPGRGAREGFLEEVMLESRLNKTVSFVISVHLLLGICFFSQLYFTCVSPCPDVT